MADGMIGQYALLQIWVTLRRGKAAVEVVNGAVLEEGRDEVEEDPSGCLGIGPVPIIHLFVKHDHIAIPLASLHEIVPLLLSVVCGDPLTEGGETAIWSLGPFEDERRDGVDINAVLKVTGQICGSGSGIYEDRTGRSGQARDQNSRIDTPRYGGRGRGGSPVVGFAIDSRGRGVVHARGTRARRGTRGMNISRVLPWSGVGRGGLCTKTGARGAYGAEFEVLVDAAAELVEKGEVLGDVV